MSFKKDSFFTLIVRLLLIVINILSVVVVARKLGPAGVGVVALINLMGELSFRFGSFGLGSSFAYHIAKGRSSLKNIFRIAIVSGLVLGFISFVFLLLVRRKSFSPWYDIDLKIYYIGALTVFSVFLNNFFQRILSGQLRIATVNLSETLRALLYLSLIIFFVLYLESGLLGAVTALLLSQLLVTVFLFFAIASSEKQKLSDSEMAGAGDDGGFCRDLRVEIVKLLRYGLWNYLVMLSNFIFISLPLIVLKIISCNNNFVGFYQGGQSIISRVQILVDSFANTLFPHTAATELQGAVQRTNVLCRNFVVFSLLMIVVLGSVAKLLIIFLLGQSFAPTVHVVYALLPAILFMPVSRFLSIHVAAIGSPRIVFLSRIVYLPAVIFCSILLIRKFSFTGAALSFSFTYLCLSLASLRAYLRCSDVKIHLVLIPQKDDWVYYQRIFSQIKSRIEPHG